jgi:hypothetical protein
MPRYDKPHASFFRPHYGSVDIVAAPPGWRVLITDASGVPFLVLEQWVDRIDDVFVVAEHLAGQELNWWSTLGRPFDCATFIRTGGRPQPRHKPIPRGTLGSFERRIAQGNKKLEWRLEALANKPLPPLPEGVPEIRGLPVEEAARVVRAAQLSFRCLGVPRPAGEEFTCWTSDICRTRVNAHAQRGVVIEVLGRY